MGWITKGGKHILIGEDGGSSGGGGGGGGSGAKSFNDEDSADNYIASVTTNGTTAEKESLDYYVGGSSAYRTINDYYREGRIYHGVDKNNWDITAKGGVKSEKLGKVTSSLDRLFSKNKTTDDIVAYRNVVLSKDMASGLVKGTTFKDLGYASTTLVESYARQFNSLSEVGSRQTKVIAKIKVPKGTNAVFTNSALSKNRGESEMILNRGCSYSIIDSKMGSDGVLNVTMEVKQ